MKIAELIKQLQDIMLIYGNKIILTIKRPKNCPLMEVDEPQAESEEEKWQI